MRQLTATTIAVLVSAVPLSAQHSFDRSALAIPEAGTELMCKQVQPGLADSAAFAFAVAVMDDLLPRAIVVTYDAAGHARTIGVSAEIFSGDTAGVLQGIIAQFGPADSINVRATVLDGALITANPGIIPEPKSLAVPIDTQADLRALAQWVWRKRCPQAR